MDYKKSAYSLLFIVAMVAFVPAVLADNCEQQPYAEDSYRNMLDELLAFGCYKLDKNQTPIGIQVKQQLDNPANDGRLRALKSLSIIQSYLDREYSSQQNTQFNNSVSLIDAIEKLKKEMRVNIDTPLTGLKSRWQVDELARMPLDLDKLNFENALKSENCIPVQDKHCEREFEQVSNLVRVIYLVNATLDTYTEKFRAEALKDRQLRTNKWDSYYDDLTFQYPWELLANNMLLEMYDNRVLVDGNKLGFRSLPGSKLVLLHPEANLVYANNAQDEYEITITVEALGFEVFDFDKTSGKVKNPWGISLLAAYVDRVDQNRSGWTGGLLFKYNGYSIGVTDNHGDNAIILNVNLSQKLFDIEKKSRRYYDEYNRRIQ